MTTENKPSTVNQQLSTDSDEISLKELIEKLQSLWKYLLTQWLKIVIVGLLGGAIGFLYAYKQPVKYIAKMTFVVEDAKSSGGGLASLAGQFGFDVGGSSGTGILSGDNVYLFLKSERVIREALFTKIDSTSNHTLFEMCVKSKVLDKISFNGNLYKKVKFTTLKLQNLSRIEDSILQVITSQIINNNLNISKPDKKSSFIEVKFQSNNELFSKVFTENLVSQAISIYLNSKLKSKYSNVNNLQHRADSLTIILNNKTYLSAQRQQEIVDLNPGSKINFVSSEITNRDKMIASTIFAEVVKNLELSKFLLNQDTPSIQIVNNPTYPLESRGKRYAFFTILFGSIFAVLFAIYALIYDLLLRKSTNY